MTTRLLFLTCAAAIALAGPSPARAEGPTTAIVFPLKRSGTVSADQLVAAGRLYHASCEAQLAKRGVKVVMASQHCELAAEGCGEEDLRCWHARCAVDGGVAVVQGELRRMGETFTIVVTARRLVEGESWQSAEIRASTWDSVDKAIDQAVEKVVSSSLGPATAVPILPLPKFPGPTTPPAMESTGARTVTAVSPEAAPSSVPRAPLEVAPVSTSPAGQTIPMLRIAAYATGGAGIALIGVGIATGLAARKAESEVLALKREDGSYALADHEFVRARADAHARYATMADVFIPVGAAAVGAAALMLYLDHKGVETKPTVSWLPKGGLEIGLTASF